MLSKLFLWNTYMFKYFMKLYFLFKKKCLNYLSLPKKNSLWLKTQQKYKDIPGEKGKSIRREKYRKFFSKIGQDVCIDENVFFEKPETIILEDGVRINRGCHFTGGGGISIGEHTLIGPYCFITSINHRIYDTQYFFKNSSYEKHIVIIKEHCLISSHVKIMPGVRLESGTFIASGSVVTKGHHKENSFICGVPAKTKFNLLDHEKSISIDKNFQENHPLALFVSSEKQFLKWSFFIKSLGLPQVFCIHNLSDIDHTIKSIVLLEEDFPQKIKEDIKKYFPHITLWVPSHFQYILDRSRDHKILLQRDPSHCLFEIPKKIYYTCVPSKPKNHFSKESIYFLTCKYALRILEKSNAVSMLDNFYAFYLAMEIEKNDPAFSKRIRDAIGSHVDLLKEDTLENLTYSLNEPYYKIHKEVINLMHGIFNHSPVYTYEKLSNHIIENENTILLCLYGLIAYFYKYKDLYDVAHDKIMEDNLCHKTFYIKASQKSTSYYYRPLLAFFLSKKYKNTLKNNPIIVQTENNFDWLIKHHKQGETIDVDDFFDSQTTSYSVSLLRNTSFLMEDFFCKTDREFLIHESNYSCIYPLLQEMWAHFLRIIILSHEDRCIQLLPWPHQSKYAVSLRYDVDRELMRQDIFRINKYIKSFWKNPCASWYFFEDDHEKNHDKIRLLISYHYEIGTHSLGGNLLQKNMGITFHSGPNSHYWGGIKKYKEWENPLYSEYLHLQLLRPSKISYEKHSFLVTPLHFPMELSTQKIKSKKINDGFHAFLSKNIEMQMHFNGHIILGSHPDITFSAIECMRKKFKLHEGWCVPVNRVTERLDTIYYKSNAKIFKNKEKYFIKSDKNLINQCFIIYTKKDGGHYYHSDIKSKNYHEILFND